MAWVLAQQDPAGGVNTLSWAASRVSWECIMTWASMLPAEVILKDTPCLAPGHACVEEALGWVVDVSLGGRQLMLQVALLIEGCRALWIDR